MYVIIERAQDLKHDQKQQGKIKTKASSFVVLEDRKTRKNTILTQKALDNP